MIGYILVLLFSLGTSIFLLHFLIPRLKRAGMVGKDICKGNQPEVAEMGGIGIVAGFTAGILLAIFLNTFFGLAFNVTFILVSLITIQSIAMIGIVDDMIDIPQMVKAFLPLVAAIPLVVVKAAGDTAVFIPFIGSVNFGFIYIFLLIPVAVAVTSNLTNMLAGYNGMEAGMGIIMFLTLAILAFFSDRLEMLLISLAMMGTLIGFFWFNRYPAKVFPGDSGTLVIGAGLSCAIIIGNFESAGVILMIPFFFDFVIKLMNRLPHTYQDIGPNGKLRPKDGKVKGLVHVVMNAFNGISEQNLTLFFISLEAFFGIIAIAIFIFKL